MSISGSLADIAIVDLLQFVHMSQRSGTLLLGRRGDTAHVSFHRGRIASAWAPSSPSVASYLLESGRIDAAQLARASQRCQGGAGALSLGQALMADGDLTWEELRDAVATKVERTILELVSWTDGSFRLLADEVRADDEISFAPGDVLPDIEIDTQSYRGARASSLRPSPKGGRSRCRAPCRPTRPAYASAFRSPKTTKSAASCSSETTHLRQGNVEYALNWLEANRIPVMRTEVLGNVARRLEFDVACGAAQIGVISQ